MITNLIAAARTPRLVHVSRGPFVEPWITYWLVVGLIVVLLGTNVWLMVALVDAKHAARLERQRACEAQAALLVARKPVLRHAVLLVDSCDYLRRLQGVE